MHDWPELFEVHPHTEFAQLVRRSARHELTIPRGCWRRLHAGAPGLGPTGMSGCRWRLPGTSPDYAGFCDATRVRT